MADRQDNTPPFGPGDRLVLGVVFVALLALLGVHYALRAGVGKESPEISGHPLGGHQVDINRAEWWELQALEGIGEKRARDIVGVRDAQGGFRSIDELATVPGIGPKTLERLRPHLTISLRRADEPGQQ